MLRAALGEGEGAPGTVLDDTLTIACGTGALRLIEVQRAGKRAMKAEDFLRGAELERAQSCLSDRRVVILKAESVTMDIG